MDWEEVEMSKEELQKWIRDEVQKSKLISPDVLKKCKLLQSILQRREKQAEHLLKLCNSVAACEAVVQKLYSMLGWDFFDTDSDDDDNDDISDYALCQFSGETNKKPPPPVPQREISVNMHVLARKGAMKWQRGEVVEILTKDDGRVKYKVNFEERGRILVSGHHIAFDCMPKVDQLFVGSRVVVKCPADQPKFCPGILSELPNRKNRMRFLIFTDDHTPVYVGLPSLYLVCRPLTDPLDDILDDTHKSFMKDYLNKWPSPPQIQYKAGQIINVEFNGVQEKCEVEVVDSSLIKVVFQKDQHKEWIYRGSIRLEHVKKLSKNLEAKHKGSN
ncbi:histone-lysine N-methyltransferase SETDB1-B-like isoform X5 [Channa argus]|uniref:histone-lysine N-methyltransferase SETDB1-B-like isoform X5 n=1 Tax=Channa argus TaxID=215402 RepID=UPI003522624A